VTLSQSIFAGILIVLLLGLAGYFSWRQWQTLRGLRSADDLPAEDRRYVRNQAWRRLAGSVLMAVFAGFLIGSFFLENAINEVTDEIKQAEGTEEEKAVADRHRPFLELYRYYWISALLVVFGMICLAAFDLLAIRRYGLRHYRQIMADRRAMIERELARYRQERNGHT